MSQLRVALDGRPLQSDPLGGVGRYLSGTLPFLAAHDEISVLVDARRPRPAVKIDPRIEVVELRAPSGVPGLGWLELAVTPWLRRFGGIFHATFNTLPLSYRGRGVLTLHDLAPQLHPEDFKFFTRHAWRLYVRASVARAAAITTVSEFTKAQIVQHFGIDPRRVQVAPDALDPLFGPERAAGAQQLTRKLGFNGPYVVALGGAPRRGLPVAVEAWRKARTQLGADVTLVATGEPRPPSEPGLVSPGYLDDEAWATLLAGAQALCYPTRYEGFGLPALEAAASGTPVVCAAVASLPEVLGDAGCWAASASPRDLGEVLVRLLSDEAWHRERRAAGLKRAQEAVTFAESAERLLAAYQRASV